MKNILIATCGTSILGHIREVKEKVLGKRSYDEMTADERKNIIEGAIINLAGKKAYEKNCGAEVNSTYYLIEKGEFSKETVYLIVSETEDGKLASEIVGRLMKEKLGVQKIEIRVVEKLNITNAHDFAIKGLRNLASTVAQVIKDNGVDDIMISPIGGMKAQILIAGIVGQIFKIPAYYLYEGSTEIVELLPLPINLDMDFFVDNIEFISKLANEEIVPKKEIDSYLKANPGLRNIIEEETFDGTICVGLSALGKLAYEKLIFDTSSKLPRDATPEEKENEILYKGNEPHADKVMNNPKCQNFLRAILDTSYVTKIIINYYYHVNEGDVKRINLSSNETEGRVLKFVYNNKQGMLKGSIFITENEDESKVKAALVDLQDKVVKS